MHFLTIIHYMVCSSNYLFLLFWWYKFKSDWENSQHSICGYIFIYAILYASALLINHAIGKIYLTNI